MIKVIEKNIGDLVEYEYNPRHNDNAVESVAKSIEEFGFKVPIVIDKNNVIVAGHTRLKASKRLGLETVPCIVADDLSEDKIKAFRLADNKVGELATWDFDLLEQELLEIEMDMSEFGFTNDDEEVRSYDDRNDKSLIDRFIAPPFSLLDSRQGYWQDRKRAWKSIGLVSENGRSEALLGNGLLELAKAQKSNLTGTSIFDPVLCELMYKWFCPDKGKVYDCFAGGSVRGVVASKLGYDYKGIELRKEQVDANYENAQLIGVEAKWYCDDSLNADKYLEDDSVDFILSCPPYADLEVYSDDPRDISNMEYEDFLKVYKEIIAIACRKLKNDRFAVFVVGDVRDKKGFYRDFVGDTKNAFKDAGMSLYNDMVLIESIGTGALRAGKQFSSMRKVVKCHQNVLVFYKGDVQSIKNNFHAIDVDEIIQKNVVEE